MKILAHFSPWDIFEFEWVLAHFDSKNQPRKIVKSHKDFKLYQIFMSDVWAKLFYIFSNIS